MVPPRDAGATASPDVPEGRSEQHLATFLDRLISVLTTLAPEAESSETRDFTTKLDEYRHIVLDPSRRLEVPRVTEACVLACQRYLQRSRDYHAEREAELAEMIAILRDAAKLSIGDACEFTQQLLASSDRFHGLVQLEDVRELKRRLTQEVLSLRTSVEEKQRRDQQAYAQLTSRVEALQAKLSAIEEEASLDPLTRISNRGRFQRTLTKWIDAAREAGTPLSIAMLDIDNFKSVNDTHGHPVGDRVLACAAQCLTKNLRQTDFVARYGGEEFVVLLSNATTDQVEARLTQIVRAVAHASVEYDRLGDVQRVKFTVSCGLTELAIDDDEEAFVRRADEALYEAKHKGKNRVVTKKPSLADTLLSWG